MASYQKSCIFLTFLAMKLKCLDYEFMMVVLKNYMIIMRCITEINVIVTEQWLCWML